MKAILHSVLIAALVALTLGEDISSAYAQNVAALPMGGRTGSLGGTGVAFGDDSAMAFLNPAGLSLVDKDHALTLSVMVPRVIQQELEGSIFVDSDFVTLSDRATLINAQRSYYIGPSYAVDLGLSSVQLRFGVSAFLVHSSLTFSDTTATLAGSVPATDFAQLEASRFTTAKSFDGVVVLGVQARFRAVSFGLSFHTPSLHLGGSYDNSARLTSFANGAFDTPERRSPDNIVQRESSGGFEQRQPYRLSAGLAVHIGALLLAADVSLVEAVGHYARLEGQAIETRVKEGEPVINETVEVNELTSQKAVLNASIGIEWRLNETWAIRAGGFTDLSATPFDRFETTDLYKARIDQFGGPWGLGIAWDLRRPS